MLSSTCTKLRACGYVSRAVTYVITGTLTSTLTYARRDYNFVTIYWKKRSRNNEQNVVGERASGSRQKDSLP